MKPPQTQAPRHHGKRRNQRQDARPKRMPKPKFTNNAFAEALAGLKLKK